MQQTVKTREASYRHRDSCPASWWWDKLCTVINLCRHHCKEKCFLPPHIAAHSLCLSHVHGSFHTAQELIQPREISCQHQRCQCLPKERSGEEWLFAALSNISTRSNVHALRQSASIRGKASPHDAKLYIPFFISTPPHLSKIYVPFSSESCWDAQWEGENRC